MDDTAVRQIRDRYPWIRDAADLRQRDRVFEDRWDAGRKLAEMIEADEMFDRSDAIVLAVPAGGVPVAVSLSDALSLPMDVAVVSKVTLPWNTEAGCGAVAFDGSVRINRPLVRSIDLRPEGLQESVEQARRKVVRRVERLRRGRGELDVEGRAVILVDDGLASGFTMQLAVTAVERHRPDQIAVAVPTAPGSTLVELAERVETLWCANIRIARPFAVASAYRQWRDLEDDEIEEMMSPRQNRG